MKPSTLRFGVPKQAGKSRGSLPLLWPRGFAAIPIMSIALNGLKRNRSSFLPFPEPRIPDREPRL